MKTRNLQNAKSVQNPTLFDVGQTYERISYAYEGNRIEFRLNGNLMINATEMAKPFGKRATDWLRLPYPIEFIKVLMRVRAKCDNLTLAENQPINSKPDKRTLKEETKARKIALTDNQSNNTYKSYYGGLVVTQRGGVNPGTWMHEDVALEFARWLSPEFAIWCNDRIKEILLRGYSKSTFDEKELIHYVGEKLQEVSERARRHNQYLATKLGFKTECMSIDISYGCFWHKDMDYKTNIDNLIAGFNNNTLGAIVLMNKVKKQELECDMMKKYLESVSRDLYSKFNVLPN